eukprot:CAMPEP_0170384424 /NCGR_PEP_ID=MMETSP0117_2-20130122/15990_1 /TAXON_ID=400756 /ORGANISM="Durinskia baltica, Strain CSIRO CS-38" /LENGTH=186 /DNA_ID=CAMNT_0010640171 /DNA_START=28 /DNA_END=585 /DNA_ORIENTATION=+
MSARALAERCWPSVRRRTTKMPPRSGGDVLLEVRDGLAHRADLVSVMIGNYVAELVLELQEHLHLVQIVEAELRPLRRARDFPAQERHRLVLVGGAVVVVLELLLAHLSVPLHDFDDAVLEADVGAEPPGKRCTEARDGETPKRRACGRQGQGRRPPGEGRRRADEGPQKRRGGHGHRGLGLGEVD